MEEVIPNAKLPPEERFISYQNDESSFVRNQINVRMSTDEISHLCNINGSHFEHRRKTDGSIEARIVPRVQRDADKEDVRGDAPHSV